MPVKEIIKSLKGLDEDVLFAMTADAIADKVDPKTNYDPLRKWLLDNTNIGVVDLRQAIHRHQRSVALSDCLGDVPRNPKHFVELFATKHGYDVKPNGAVLRRGKYDRFSAFMTEVRLAAFEFRDLGYDKGILGDAGSSYKRDVIEAKIDAIRHAVAYSPEAEQQAEGVWQQLERAWFDPVGDRQGFSVAGLKKFMQQIKCKLNGVPVKDHLMPIIVGRQGLGKSKLVEHLVAPLSEVLSTANFDDIQDKRNVWLWDNYIVWMQEMEKADRADMAAVKGAITRDFHNARVMYTTESDFVVNNVTFIGDSNFSVGSSLWDPSGMRRFAELPCRQDIDCFKEAWPLVNSTDFALLWQSVDECGADPMRAFEPELKAQQESFRAKTQAEEWLRDDDRDAHRLCPLHATDWRGFKSLKKLYIDNFKPWHDNMGAGRYTWAPFKRDVMDLIRNRSSELGLQHRTSSKDVELRLEEHATQQAKKPIPTRMLKLLGRD